MKLKASDLRLGNWVQDPLGNYFRVTILGDEKNPNYIYGEANGAMAQNMFEGIPLTPELLEKCHLSVEAYLSMQALAELKYLHQLQNLYFALMGLELAVKL
jgi:hypothetical protein